MGPDASLTPELIQAQSFTTAFRGYDGAEVKAFLTRVANEMRAWKERAEGLESAWHSAEERAARPPVLDEDTLMAAVGEETAAILRTARAAAADMRSKAAEESERLLAEARAEAEQALTEARSEAERVATDARAETERSLTEARNEAERLVGEAESALTTASAAAEAQAAALLAAARQEATEVLERAASEAEDVRAQAEKERQLTIEGANNTRDRILEDLGRRRRVATVQIEQLRAGRERLIESYAMVRRTLEEVQSELSRADAEARAAADEVGRRLRDEPEVELSESSRQMTEPLRRPEARAEQDDAPLSGPTPGDGAEPQEASVVALAVDPEPPGLEPPADQAPDGQATVTGTQAAALEAPPAGERPAEPGAGGSAVDELFARIRATRAAVGARPDTTATAEQPAVEAESAPPVVEAETPAGDTGAGVPEQPASELPASELPASELPVAPVDEAPVPERASTGRRGSKKRPGSEPAANGRHPGPTGPAKAAPARATVRLIEPETEASEGDRRAESQTPSGDVHDADGPVADGEESLMQAREFAIVDLEVNLTRRLKRALQDEQNDVLDRLRNLKGAPTAERLLPDEKSQIARYSGAARPLLAEAASAGAVFTDETLGLPGRDAPVEVDTADLAEDCGSGIVSPLRRRLEQAIQIGGGDDQAVLVESLGAAYREWKTQRIERLAGDVLSAAFSRGTWQAAPGSARFRWVVEDVDGPCPDCDDDGLAGDIPKGEAFPTGQHHPPAHSGCRCLLVPSLPGD